MADSIAVRLAAVEADITAACEAAGRARGEVRLLPVSKTHPGEVLREAYAAGVRTLAENKAQELAAKAEELADLADLRWAAVGHLQTNKAKVVAELATEFHALDSVKVAEALDRRLQPIGRSLDVFVQVNSSGEDSKFGLAPADVPGFARELAAYQSLRVVGLMTLAANSDDEDAVAACFRRMQDLQQRLRDDSVPGSFDELSMGMSGDFRLAIAHGATVVRVGSAIFGARSHDRAG